MRHTEWCRATGVAAVVGIASIAAGCAPRTSAAEQAAPSGAVRSDSIAIVAAANAFSAAYMRGDADSMAALYTEDAAIFPDASPALVGREPIRRYWTLRPNRRVTHHALLPDRIEIVGDVAHDYGRFQVSGETDGTPWGPSFGKYVVVWRKGTDGQWRMYLDMWNRGPQQGG